MSPPLLAVGLVAGGALALEVLLTRILAIVHWHHFAGMVISLALLGYGASGSALTPLLDRLRPHAPLAFAGAATLFGLAAVVSVAVAQAVPFNALELIWAAAAVALARGPLPAVRGALLLRRGLHRAGAGLLPGAGRARLPLRPARRGHRRAGGGRAAGLRPSRPARCRWSPRRDRSRPRSCWQGRTGGLPPPRWSWPCCWSAWPPHGWPALRISPFKPLPQALLVEGTAIVAERTSPIGLVQVVRSERVPFRIVSGLSLMNRQEPAPQLGLFVDGEGPVPVTRFTGAWGPLAYLDSTLAALPYQLQPDRRPRVLLLGLGGGADLLLALRHGAARIDVVEPDGSVADLLGGELAGFAGPILTRPEVRLHVDTARRFTRRSPKRLTT